MRIFLYWLLLFCCSAKAQEHNSYTMLAGSIGRYPVVLHLHKAGDRYMGYYYYANRQQPLAFHGTDTTGNGAVHLVVPGASEDEHIRMAVKNGSYLGVWQSGAKILPFTAAPDTVGIAFSFYDLERDEVGQPDSAGAPRGSFSFSMVWPETDKKAPTLSAALKKELLAFISEQPPSAEPQAVMQAAGAAYLEHYRQEVARASPKDLAEKPSMYTRDLSKSAMVVYQGKAFLSLALFTYAFSGGAHGNYGTNYRVFNNITGKRLLLKDVLTPAGVKALPRLLATAYRAQNGMRPNAPLTEGGLFDGTINATENFWVTGKAIGFNYVPYEIGPYARGEVTIPLAFSRIRGYLRPGFVSLLKKN